MINDKSIEHDKPLKHISSQWEILNQLGKGSYGSVYKAKKLNGLIKDKEVDICAIKKIEKKKFNQEEVNVLKKVNPWDEFLKYYGYGIDDDNYYIYMQYIEGAISIRDRLDNGYKFSEDEIIDISGMVLEAIIHLHDRNIAHRDIKSDHILLIYYNDNGNNRLINIKLIDLGCSKTLEINNTKYYTSVGTAKYTAPEVKLQNGKASRKSDIYSFGCVLLEMLGGDLTNTDDQGIQIVNTIPVKFKQIIQQCLVNDPNGRPNARDVSYHSALTLKSSYLSSYNHSALTVGVVPNGVWDLNLSSYNHPLTVGVIPNSVWDLNLSSYNHSALSVGIIPDSVKYLNLSSYNHPLTVGVINSVINLNLSSYNHSALSVCIIPNSVWGLDLSSYNHSALAVGIIPNSVTSLYLLSYHHSALTVGIIPNSVKYLDLSSYNHSALEVGVIPNSVERLNLSSYNHPLTVGVIPDSVKYLNLSSYNHSALEVGIIPNGVIGLYLSSYNHSALTVGVIPNSVNYLYLSSYNHPLSSEVIHCGVQELSFKKFNHYIENDVIPASVTSLDLGEEFELSLNGEDLPLDSIITLKCSFDFSKDPQKPHNQRLLNQRDYPTSVINLSLPNYNLPLKKNSISKSISTLELGSNFKHFETLAFIPSTVYQLTFGDPEFSTNESLLQSYLSKIKPHIIPSISKLIINGHDVSEELYQQVKI